MNLPLQALRDPLWAAAAGALIPVMAILNARLGRAAGEPLHAVWWLFVIGLLTTSALALLATGRLPAPAALLQAAPLHLHAGGLIVAFYVLSVTLLVPRFGVGPTIVCVLAAQIVTSALIDHHAAFGALHRPLTPARLLGLALLLAGVALVQFADRTPFARH